MKNQFKLFKGIWKWLILIKLAFHMLRKAFNFEIIQMLKLKMKPLKIKFLRRQNIVI